MSQFGQTNTHTHIKIDPREFKDASLSFPEGHVSMKSGAFYETHKNVMFRL